MTLYQHWSAARLELPKDVCIQAKALWPEQNLYGCFNDPHALNHFFIVALEDNQVKACAHAGVYDDSCHVPDQPYYEENKFRRYWISHIVSKASRGVASQLLRECEAWLKAQADSNQDFDWRRNCYVYTYPSATGFYRKNGYTAIVMQDDEDDDNDEYTWQTWQEHLWMAKGMDSGLDRESEVGLENLSLYSQLNLGLPVLHYPDSDWSECIEELEVNEGALDIELDVNYRDPERQQIKDKLKQLSLLEDCDIIPQEELPQVLQQLSDTLQTTPITVKVQELKDKLTETIQLYEQLAHKASHHTESSLA